jgi:hypothetical protein
MTTTIRLGAPSTRLTLLGSTPASATGPLIGTHRSREQLLCVVGVGERMVAWVGETACTVLGMSCQEFVWGTYPVDDSGSSDPVSFDMAWPYRRGSCSAADSRHPGGVAA